MGFLIAKKHQQSPRWDNLITILELEEKVFRVGTLLAVQLMMFAYTDKLFQYRKYNKTITWD